MLADTVLTAAGGYVSWLAVASHVWPANGRVGRAGLPAWVSGLSFGAGLITAGSSRVSDGILNGQALNIVAAAFAAFLLIVLAIQRHMRFSMFANSFGSPSRLATDGIFRYSRNPIYVAFLIPIASIASVSVPAAMSAAGLYILVMNLTVIRNEERELSAAFGAEYAAFQRATPRWIV